MPSLNDVFNSGGFGNAGVTQYQNDTPVQAQSDGWFSHLLPTIGSVAAPVLGALLAPETGGASLLAGAALSGLGSGAGKVAENAMEQKGLGSGVLGSVGEGAAGGAIGGVGGKLLGGLLSKVAGAGAENVASQTAADSFAPYTAVAGKARNALDNLTNMRNLGVDISNPQNVLNASSAVTGENGVLNGIKNDLISQAGPATIDPDQLMSKVKSAIAGNPQIGSKAGATQDFFHNMIQSWSPSGNLTGTYDPASIFQSIKDIDKARSALNMGGESGPGIANVYNTAKSALEDALYNNAGADKLAAAYSTTPEEVAALMKSTTGVENPALARHMADALNNAKGISDIRGAESPFVQSSDLANKALQHAQTVLPTAAETTSSPLDHVGALAQLARGNWMGAAGQAIGGGVQGAEKVAGAFTGLPSAAKAAILTGAGMGATEPFAHAGDYTQGGGSALPATINQGASATGGTMNPTQGAPGADTNTITPDMFTKVVLADLSTTGGKNLGTIVPAMQAAMFGGLGQLSGGQRDQVANSQTATQGLDGLTSAFGSAGGGQGPLVGTLANLTGGINPNLKAYNAEAQGEATKIAAATGMSPQTALQMLPQITDSHEIAQQKLARIAQLLQTNASNATQSGFQTPGFGAGGTPVAGLSGLGSSAQVGAGLGAIAR